MIAVLMFEPVTAEKGLLDSWSASSVVSEWKDNTCCNVFDI